MKHRIYPIWRPAYEIYSFAVWLAVAGAMYLLEQGGGAMALYLRALWIAALFAAVVRLVQCFALWERKAQFTLQADFQMSSKQIDKLTRWAQKMAKKGKMKVET